MRTTLAALFFALVATVAGWTAGVTSATPVTPAPASQPELVQAFNDGWTEGMFDACDQGSDYACGWLREAGR
ncbi:hypothetical protein [Kitasatospora sp. McL0602]|uniref:hypothetical protein n=1 Tax=Kitasatospora sp. McL0602 TaxID=3439530 RepID=UPI003F8B4C8C